MKKNGLIYKQDKPRKHSDGPKPKGISKENDIIKMNAKRLRVYFSGRVQGVGFRWTVRDIAKSFVIDGYVKNLADGRVELVAEGEEGQVSAFIDAINERMGGYIRDMQTEKEQPDGEKSGFNVTFQ